MSDIFSVEFRQHPKAFGSARVYVSPGGLCFVLSTLNHSHRNIVFRRKFRSGDTRYCRYIISFQVNGVWHYSHMLYHRLIAAVWLNCPDGYVVDHLNTCPSDNRLQNLECVTPEENRRRARITNRYKREHNCRAIGPEVNIYQLLNIPEHGKTNHSGRPYAGRDYFQPTDYVF